MTKRIAEVSTLLLLVIVAGGLLYLVPGARAQGGVRIAYIDVQRILARSSAGVAAR